jgi:phage-related protein
MTKFYIEIYETTNGQCPVGKFLSGLSKEAEAKSYRELELLAEFGFELGSKKVKQIGPHIWELRFWADRSPIRLVFTISKQVLVVVHGFKKKTQKIPSNDLKLSEQRVADYIQRNS